jgi:hypothetical protein
LRNGAAREHEDASLLDPLEVSDLPITTPELLQAKRKAVIEGMKAERTHLTVRPAAIEEPPAPDSSNVVYLSARTSGGLGSPFALTPVEQAPAPSARHDVLNFHHRPTRTQLRSATLRPGSP